MIHAIMARGAVQNDWQRITAVLLPRLIVSGPGTELVLSDEFFEEA
jgi:hypothetical protein